MQPRREFLASLGGAAYPSLAMAAEPFRLWAFSDAHVGTDLRQGRESLASAIAQSEFGDKQGAPPFDWNIAVDLGDQSGAQGLPNDEEGEQVVRQFAALKKHRREDVYSLCGNHDRSGLQQPKNTWWRKWLDPTGENSQFSRVDPKRRRYAVEGTWERYSFRVGNVLFLMMSDINEPSQKIGRDTLGGNPSGVVTGETFEWWKKMVESNRDSIIVSAHHYMLKNTTVASGEWEGMRKGPDGNWVSHYHGLKPQGTPKGASYLYWVNSVEDAQAFERYLEAHPGAISLWLGGHTHTNPDDTYGGKRHIETKWGVHFVNVSALTAHHVKTSVPMSRLLSFEGNQVRIQCYLHTDHYAPRGWYDKVERRLPLTRAFRW